MKTLWLRVKAPFAVFRYFQAGVYRSSAPIIPYSAAWGLVLNLAGVEIRTKLDSPVTEIDPAAPRLLLAVGAVEHCERNTLYQQLHTYPVGTSGKEFATRAKGAKYWIAPARREVLTGLDALIGVKTSDADILEKISRGLQGESSEERYGLPFAGDNNFLFDDISLLAEPVPVYWYCPVENDEVSDLRQPRSCRLTVRIDRANSSNTGSLLCAPQQAKSSLVPNSAWIWTPDEPGGQSCSATHFAE